MSNSTIPTTEGRIPFVVRDQTYETWYKIFGDFKTATRTPLVALHGGPGLTHDYILPISHLWTTASIPVIFYDQLGSGHSSHIHDVSETFWTINLFIDELLNLVTALGIADKFDILGHSWGGALAVEMEIRRQPQGLRHIILSNSLASLELWYKAEEMLKKQLPKKYRDALAAGKEADEAAYKEAMEYYHGLHACTVKPWPEELQYSVAQSAADPTVVRTMVRGDYSEKWSVIGKLHTVRIPAFVVNGRADMAQDFVCEPF